MDKEEALKELNKLCDSIGESVAVQKDEFTSKEFGVSRGCSDRTARSILSNLEKEGIVTRRTASCKTGGKVVWRFVQETSRGITK